jgi:ribonuclease HI
MIAIHETLSIINTQYPNEPAFIFTNSLNVLNLLNTQIKHPTLHNSHPDQTTLASMVKILQKRTQPITLYKVRAHVNIDGNEKADKLAKEGLELEHIIAAHPYEHAHATPLLLPKRQLGLDGRHSGHRPSQIPRKNKLKNMIGKQT